MAYLAPEHLVRPTENFDLCLELPDAPLSLPEFPGLGRGPPGKLATVDLVLADPAVETLGSLTL